MAFNRIINEFSHETLKTHNITGTRVFSQLDEAKIMAIKFDVLMICGGSETQWGEAIGKIQTKLRNFRNNKNKCDSIVRVGN